MTAIDQSHRDWIEAGKLIESARLFLQEGAAGSPALSPQPTIELRHYDPRRLGYSLTRHPAAEFSRSRTSGGSPPLLDRDVLRSNGSLFCSTDTDGSGLPHVEAKLAAFKHKYQELSVERAFPRKFEVRPTHIQQRVKTALKSIVHVEESKRSGEQEDGEVVQNTLVISCGPQRVMMEVKQSLHLDSSEAARKKAADAAAAAAAAAKMRAQVDAPNSEAAAATKQAAPYNHTGAEESAKPHTSSHRPGPGGGGGGVSRVVGAEESAERDKYNSEKRNEVRMATPHTGSSKSEDGAQRLGRGSPGQRRGKAGAAAQALSPIAQAYATKPWTRIQVLPSRRSVVNQQPWDIAYALQPQDFFDARLKRKTDAVTGRVSKYAAENNRLWMKDIQHQSANSLAPVGLPDRKFPPADRPWASLARSSQTASPTTTRARAATASSMSSPSPEWRLPAPPPETRISPLKRMIDVGVFEPAAACPKGMEGKFTSGASMTKSQLKQWRHLMNGSSYGGLLGVAEDASKLGHIRRRVPELAGS